MSISRSLSIFAVIALAALQLTVSAEHHAGHYGDHAPEHYGGKPYDQSYGDMGPYGGPGFHERYGDYPSPVEEPCDEEPPYGGDYGREEPPYEGDYGHEEPPHRGDYGGDMGGEYEEDCEEEYQPEHEPRYEPGYGDEDLPYCDEEVEELPYCDEEEGYGYDYADDKPCDSGCGSGSNTYTHYGEYVEGASDHLVSDTTNTTTVTTASDASALGMSVPVVAISAFVTLFL